MHHALLLLVLLGVPGTLQRSGHHRELLLTAMARIDRLPQFPSALLVVVVLLLLRLSCCMSAVSDAGLAAALADEAK